MNTSASFAGMTGRPKMRTKPKTTGALHSGSKKGPKVTKRKQAVAIALSEAGKSKRRG